MIDIIVKKQDYNKILNKNGVPQIVWCFWFKGTMNEVRTQSLGMMKDNLGVPLCLISQENIQEFILDKFPLHEAFDLLSDVHKSDYFRIYLLHHYGGGWHDIKPTKVNYKQAWNEFDDPNVYFVGKPEIKKGPARVHDKDGIWMPKKWEDLVATNRWIGRAKTPLSQEIYDDLNLLLDNNLEDLRKNPARKPYDQKRSFLKRLIKFQPNNYPLPWTVFGNIFHPLNYKYRQHIKKTLPVDSDEILNLPHR